MPSPDQVRPLTALVRSLVDAGVDESEIAEALSCFGITEGSVRQARFWRPDSKFTRPERAAYKDLLAYLAWRLPYWTPGPDGRLELLDAEVRGSAVAEKRVIEDARLERMAETFRIEVDK